MPEKRQNCRRGKIATFHNRHRPGKRHQPAAPRKSIGNRPCGFGRHGRCGSKQGGGLRGQAGLGKANLTGRFIDKYQIGKRQQFQHPPFTVAGRKALIALLIGLPLECDLSRRSPGKRPSADVTRPGAPRRDDLPQECAQGLAVRPIVLRRIAAG